MARSNSSDAAFGSFSTREEPSSIRVDSNVWLDTLLIAQNLQSNDRPPETAKTPDAWKPDKIFLAIDASGSMAEKPLSGMSQLNAYCVGDRESTVKNMSFDSRSKLEQLKDVIATFISGLDDVNTCSGRIFGLSVDPKTHKPFFDQSKEAKKQTGSLFGQDEEVLGRKQRVERIKSIEPVGQATPVAMAIDQCRQDAIKSVSKQPLLALWTDGRENCGGNVCEEIEQFATEFPGGRIVVFGLDPTVQDQFDCVGLKALGDRFKFVDARDPNKSLEVLGKMSNQQTHAILINKNAHGKVVPEELSGKALPYQPDRGDVNDWLQENDDEAVGNIYGKIIRPRKPK